MGGGYFVNVYRFLRLTFLPRRLACFLRASFLGLFILRIYH